VFLPVGVVSRKLIALFITAILLIISIALFVIFSTAPPTEPPVSVSQKKGLVFIEKVLPLDISKYNVTFKPPFAPPPLNATELIETYSLESDESTLDVSCTFENNVLRICMIDVKKGSVISDRPYASIIDEATSFLIKYQNYTNISATEMINMLSNVNPTKDTTITSGNLKLTISNGEFPVGTKTTAFNWKYVFSNCEYTGLTISFDNGTFAGLSDTRGLYIIGNTTVNVSMRQAIDAAMKYIKNYSYKLAEDVWISDFNVTGTSAGLFSTVREPYVLYPYWQVKLFLDKTYPGSVDGLLVLIWANSAEVFDCSHFKYRWPPEY
jgi:hypothetical protein